MEGTRTSDWRYLIRMGLLAGVVALYTSMIGMVEVFSARALIAGILTLGQVLLFAAPLAAGFLFARRWHAFLPPRRVLSGGALAGLLAAVPLVALVFLTQFVNVRAVFVNVSPPLITLITFSQGAIAGSVILLVVMAVLGLLGAGARFASQRLRQAFTTGAIWTLGIGLLGDLLIQILRPLFGSGFIAFLFQRGAPRPLTALILFAIVAGISILWASRREQVWAWQAGLNQRQQVQLHRGRIGLGTLLLLALPWILGTYLSEVIDNVGLFILMGLGLNIAVGLAGLLDLGYVTNFAVGAYLMGVLMTTGPLGAAQWPFWVVAPLCIVAAMITGFILALPVLRMRGDYLAIATLGFGEIIRILALSDWLAPLIGGAQGILFIPKPVLGDFVFRGPQQLYYIILAGCLLTLYVSVRLNNSRTGRQWMALREDEDVAAAMGIDTVKTKLLAFTLSAASGGLAGAIFATKLGTIFPHSFNLLISINVLSVIIVGGMGSVPGIVLGAFVLVGLPELLREFAEYRLLMYGALLIVMMLSRPEGLWPSAVRQRELHVDEDEVEEATPVVAESLTAD